MYIFQKWVVGACLTVGSALIAARAPYGGNKQLILYCLNVTSKNKRKFLINFLNQLNFHFNFYIWNG